MPRSARDAERTCYLVGHAHIDASWLWTRGETLQQVCPMTFRDVLGFLKEFPELRFTQSSAQYYFWMEQYYPEIFEGIRQAVAQDRWEIVSGSWVEHSGLLLGEESAVRQHLYAQRYFQSRFAKTAHVGWLPDTFGFVWTMPQIYRNFGIEYFYTHKLKWQSSRHAPIPGFPYFLFRWRGPDGSEVLATHSVGDYNDRIQQEKLIDRMGQVEKRHGLGMLLVVFGRGDHGGGPLREMIERAEALRASSEVPFNTRYVSAEGYFQELAKAAEKVELPVMDDELYVASHRGTLTSESFVKVANRRCEVLLVDLERLSVLAARQGLEYPREQINDLWRMLLFNQVHDNLDGTSIEEVYNDAATDYTDILRRGGRLLRMAMAALGGAVDTAAISGRPMVVFNTLPWRRDELLLVAEPENGGVLADAAGRPLLQQTLNAEDGSASRLCHMIDMPATGHKTFQWLEKTEAKAPRSDLAAEGLSLSNSLVELDVDKETGWLRRLYDKQLAADLLDENGLRLRVYKDRQPKEYPWREPAWNLYLSNPTDLGKPESVELIEAGPLRATIRSVYRLGDSEIAVDVSLTAGRRRAEITLSADWHEKFRTVRLVAGLGFETDFATYEIPFGCIQRYADDLSAPPATRTSLPDRPWEARDMLKFEVSALRWVDATDRDGRMGLLMLNDGRYGFSLAEGELRMTFLRSPSRAYDDPPQKWTDQSNLAYVGRHVVRCALGGHEGDFRRTEAARDGLAFNHPLLIGGGGAEPTEAESLRIAPAGVVGTAWKMAEDNDQTIVRIYESRGKATEAKLVFDRPIAEADRVDMMETGEFLGTEQLNPKGGELTVALSPFQIATVRVRLQ